MKKELVKHNTISLFTTHQEVNRWEGKEVELKWWLISWLLHSCFVELNCIKCFCFSTHISAISAYFPENIKICSLVLECPPEELAEPGRLLRCGSDGENRGDGLGPPASPLSTVVRGVRRIMSRLTNAEMPSTLTKEGKRVWSTIYDTNRVDHCFDSWRLNCLWEDFSGRLRWLHSLNTQTWSMSLSENS